MTYLAVSFPSPRISAVQWSTCPVWTLWRGRGWPFLLPRFLFLLFALLFPSSFDDVFPAYCWNTAVDTWTRRFPDHHIITIVLVITGRSMSQECTPRMRVQLCESLQHYLIYSRRNWFRIVMVCGSCICDSSSIDSIGDTHVYFRLLMGLFQKVSDIVLISYTQIFSVLYTIQIYNFTF